jgi:signal transduction histidine kinase
MLELSQSISSSLDLSEVLEEATEAVARSVSADWAHILLPLDGKVDALEVRARYGWWGSRKMQERKVRRRVVIRLNDYSLLRHAVTTRRQVRANAPRDYEQFERLHDQLGRPQSGPTLIQPIFVEDQVLGVALIGYIDKQRSFSQADGELCHALVSNAATAIENARQYEQLDLRTKRLAQDLANLERETTLLQAVINSAAEAVMVAGPGGEVILTNPAAERLLGNPPDRSAVSAFREVLVNVQGAAGIQRGVETVLPFGDRMLRASVAPVAFTGEVEPGLVAVFRDITRGYHLERKFEEYVSSAAQKLRGPVSAITGSSELLSAGAVGELNFQQQEFVEGIATEADRLAELANNLVALSEVELGSTPIEARPVDLRSVIEDAVQAAQTQAAASQLDILVDLPTGLRPAMGDRQALRQIVDNTLRNAMLASPVGGRVWIWAVEAHLTGGDQDSRNHLVVSVRDSGTGLDSGELERVFDKFNTREGAAGGDGATGMEMAVVRSLVEAHNGRITVESEPGGGTVFTFTLPAQSG